MSTQKKTSPAVKPAAAAKPQKKLIPRPAPKAEPINPVPPLAPEAVAPVAPVVQAEVAMPSATAAAAKSRPKTVRKPSAVDETVAKHQKVLAEALVKAQAISYEQPIVVGQPEVTKGQKPGKPAKTKKTRLVRDSYAMPEAEYAQIAVLKKRLVGLGREAKKSELLRAGVALLAALNDAELQAVMGRVERIKTGRPAK